jgi:uncharacterized protein (TIGR02679 family)
MIDRDRLTRLFSSAELTPLLTRLRQRMERGHPLTGTIVLSGLGAGQRSAVAGLLGRPPALTGDQFVSVSLDELAASLVDAGLCDSLTQLVEVLTGPVADTPDKCAETEQRWASVFAHAPQVLTTPPFAAVLQRWRETGSLKRLARNSPVAANELLARTAAVAGSLPASGLTLAHLAANRLGHAHGLDTGQPVATLALQLATALAGAHPPDTAEERRNVWAAVGVLCDELSAPALAFNLPATGDGYTATLLRQAANVGEPVHLSLRMLLRHPLATDAVLRERTIFVCENATIVALAAEQLGRRCAPLVSIQGQYATPTRVLLRQLCAAGARLRYHGDFDCGGLGIARRLFAEFAVTPWRFGAADYAAAPKSERFRGDPGQTPWDPPLALAMARDGRLVHEEAVFDSLASDLAQD